MPAPPRTRDVQKGLHANYLRKAEGFARSAEAALSRGDFDAAVSAAVHAAINLVDALTVFYLGQRHAGESHEGALALFRRLPLDKDVLERGADHLSALLGVKTEAEYAERLATEREARAAQKHLDRLRTLARDALPP